MGRSAASKIRVNSILVKQGAPDRWRRNGIMSIPKCNRNLAQRKDENWKCDSRMRQLRWGAVTDWSCGYTLDSRKPSNSNWGVVNFDKNVTILSPQNSPLVTSRYSVLPKCNHRLKKRGCFGQIIGQNSHYFNEKGASGAR
jgi:hypothetical protein